jgi:ABC-type branched-subunit amino acid transport system permease subunit
MKEKIYSLLEKIWNISKGNRTIFLSILWGCVEAGLIPITGGWLTFARIVFTALGAYTVKKHAKAGHFSPKKMVPEK